MNFLKRIFSRFHPGDHWRTADGSIVKLLTVDPIIGTLIGGNTTVRYNSKGVSYWAENSLVKKLLPEPGDVWISKYGHKIQITSAIKGELEGMFEDSGALFYPLKGNLRTLYMRNHHDSVGSQYITTTGRRVQITLNMGQQSKGVDLETNETVIISSTGSLWSNTPDRLEKSVPTKGENMSPLKVGQVWETEKGPATIVQIDGNLVRARTGNPPCEVTFAPSYLGDHRSITGQTLKHLISEALPEAPLEFKVGHSYLTADGDTLKLIQKTEYLWLDGNKGTERRSLEGRYYLSNGRSSPKDLVKEAPTLKLEVGHTYTDASGTLTYKVVATDAPVVGYPVVAYKYNGSDWMLVGLTANGRISSVYTHVMDVVRELENAQQIQTQTPKTSNQTDASP